MPNPFQPVSRGDNPYVMLDVGEGTGGNFVLSPIAGDHPFWLADVQVQDMSKTFEAGGSVVSGQAQQPARLGSRSARTRGAPSSAGGRCRPPNIRRAGPGRAGGPSAALRRQRAAATTAADRSQHVRSR